MREFLTKRRRRRIKRVFVVQGKLPVQFGSMVHLRRLVLSDNKMSGDLNDFSEAIPKHSKLQSLSVANNQFSGPLFAPALIRLAVFSSMRDEYQTEFDRRGMHVFDASGNKLIGEISQELLQVCFPRTRTSRYVDSASVLHACLQQCRAACKCLVCQEL
jgi:hypothetical protein